MEAIGTLPAIAPYAEPIVSVRGIVSHTWLTHSIMIPGRQDIEARSSADWRGEQRRWLPFYKQALTLPECLENASLAHWVLHSPYFASLPAADRRAVAEHARTCCDRVYPLQAVKAEYLVRLEKLWSEVTVFFATLTNDDSASVWLDWQPVLAAANHLKTMFSRDDSGGDGATLVIVEGMVWPFAVDAAA